MKTTGSNPKSPVRRMLCLLLAVLTICLMTAAAEDTSFDDAPDVILARDAAERLRLREPDGTPLKIQINPSIAGRGAATEDGSEPDYTGLIGFAALPNDPEISKFSIFDKAFWTVPQYKKTDEGYVQDGTIAHKLPIVITGQDLTSDGAGMYTGYLEAVRLDEGTQCVLEASCFVTLPYWTLSLQEVSAYGYCLAVYRETTGVGPKDGKGESCMLRDGTRVLIPYAGACPDENPNPDKLQVQGIVFQEDSEGNIRPKTVYFRQEDLTLTY